MDYLRIYIQLIKKRRQFPINKKSNIFGKVEYHHIIPIGCGGNNTPRKKVYNNFGTNLIGLTVKEHFIAHHLLIKIYKNTPYEKSTLDAFNMMAIMRNDKTTGIPNGIKISSKTYEMLRKHAAHQMSIKMKNHIPWNKGKKMSLEQRKNMIGRHWTEEAKQKIRGKKASAETKQKLSMMRKGRKAWNKGLKMSNEFKKKCSETHKVPHRAMTELEKIKISQRRKNTTYITDGTVIRVWKLSDPLPIGFHYGRK